MEPLETRLLLAADALEPDDTFGQATELGSNDHTFEDLTIHAPNNDDYFIWTAPQDGVLKVDLFFTHLNGDLDLELYDSTQRRIELSDNLGDNEQVTSVVNAGESYFIRVLGFGGAINTYDLVVDGPESLIPQDDFEPNNTVDKSSDLGSGDQALGALTIHSFNDEDWYKWTAAENGFLVVDVLFSHSLGNVDIELFDAKQNLIQRSSSTTDNEQVSTVITFGESYFLRVFTPGVITQPSYQLIIDGPEVGVPPDQYEPNDTMLTATDLGPGDAALNDLTIHEKNNDDWFRWVASDDGEVTIDVLFLQALGNVDLELYSSSGSLIAKSSSSTSNEQIVATVSGGEEYFIRIYGVKGSLHRSYDVRIDGPDIQPDAYEPNDTFAAPTDFGTVTDQSRTDLTIHAGIFPVVEETQTGATPNPPFQPAVNEIQTITILPQGGATDGSFTLSIDTSQTGNLQTKPIAYNAGAATVEAALDTAYGADGFSVTGGVKGPYIVEFVGSLGAKNITGLFSVDVSDLVGTHLSNDDYFKWTASDNGLLTIDVLFENDFGNLDVEVLDSTQSVIASGTSTTDNEQVTTTVEAGQKYVVRVFGVKGAVHYGYDLLLDGPGVVSDAFEPNDSVSEAYDLGFGDQAHANLTVHEPFNADWYRWTAARTGMLEVTAMFNSSLGDIDLELYQADGTFLAESNSVTDTERVTHSVVGGQAYLVHVFAVAGATQPNYTLTIDGPGPNRDALEPNDSVANSYDLGTGDQNRADLTIHLSGNEDWYKWTAAAGGLMTVDLLFSNSQGDVNLELYDSDQNLLGASASTTDNEQVATTVVTDQMVYVRVVGAGDSLQDNYDLVLTANDPPTIQPIQDVTTSEDLTSAPIPVTISDDGTQPEQLSVSVTSSNLALVPSENLFLGGSGGSLTLTLTPLANASGETTISVTAVDSEGGTTVETFVATVEAVADAPTLQVADTAGDEDAALPLSITAGLTDTDGSETLSVEITDVPAGALLSAGTNNGGGMWTLASADLAGLTITPPADSDNDFTLTVTAKAVESSNSDSSSALGLIDVTVSAVADPPSVKVLDAAGMEDTVIPLTITASLLDTDGSETGSVAITGVPNGSILSAGTDNGDGSWALTMAQLTGLTITPSTGGDHPLTVTATAVESDNGDTAESSATLLLSVESVNDDPTITDIPDQLIEEDGSAGPLAFTIGDSESAADDLVVVAASDNPTLVAGSDIVIEGSGSERSLTVTPAANEGGVAAITVTVSDPDGGVTSDTFILGVTPVNDEPTISDIADQSTPEDTPTGVIEFTVSDVETAADMLLVGATSDNQTLVPDANIVVEGSGNLRTLIITPAPNESGSATISVAVSDDENGVVVETFVLEVGSVNDLPTISAIADQSTLEDTATPAVAFSISDIETPAESLTVSGTSDNPALVPDANIVVDGAGGARTVTITPAQDQAGTANVTLTVVDGDGGEATVTFAVEVTAINDAPTISDISDQTTLEDTATSPLSFTVSDVETPLDQLTVTGVSSDPALVPDANIVIEGEGNARTVTITPAANQSGTTTIIVQVSDGEASATDTIVLEVVAVNDLPTVSDIPDQAIAEDGATQPLDFSISDVETAADALVVTATSDNQALLPDGNITLAGSGSQRTLTATPVADLSGLATVTVTVEDADGGQSSDTFVLEVGDINDDPTISDVSDQSTDEDVPIEGLAVTVTDTETPLDSLTVSATSDNPTLVPDTNITITGTGSDRVLAIVPAEHESGTATITVTVDDGDGGTASDTFQLNVSPVNDAPQITSSDAVSVPENTTAVMAVTATDPDGDTPTFALTGGADQALFAINNTTGSLSFLSATDFESPADADGDNVYEVEVSSSDGNGGLTAQPIQITVTDEDEDVPTVNIVDVSPDLRAGAVDEITIVFSEPVAGFDVDDLSLTLSADDTESLSLASATLTTADDITWTLGNLGGLTAASGVYGLTLTPVGSGIVDLGGNSLAAGDVDQWINGPGDANRDGRFDQFDLVKSLQGAKYLTGQPATWSQGDWNGDGVYDQFDIIAAQQPAHYLQGSFAATQPSVAVGRLIAAELADEPDDEVAVLDAFFEQIGGTD